MATTYYEWDSGQNRTTKRFSESEGTTNVDIFHMLMMKIICDQQWKSFRQASKTINDAQIPIISTMHPSPLSMRQLKMTDE